jgi:hypothetical protein
MNNEQNGNQTISKYDRIYGGLHHVSLSTKPSTIKNVQTLTGQSETFVVQTFRHEDLGDYIFIEHLSEDGVVRLALPPKVSAAIASQKDSLTKRRRSISSKRVMRERMDGGWVPSFKKKSAKKK